MDKKLAYLSTVAQKKWNSLSRALTFSATLILALITGFFWLTLLIYLLVSFVIYLKEPRGRTVFKSSYWIFVLSAPGLLIAQAESGISVLSSAWLSIVLIILLGVLFTAILELMERTYANEDLAYSIINTGILVTLFIAILSIASPFSFGLAGIILFLFITALFNELLLFIGLTSKRSILLSSVVGFLSLELSWVTLILPIGVLNSAALLTLILVLTRDFLKNHFKGNLSVNFVFRQVTFLVFFMILILAASNRSL